MGVLKKAIKPMFQRNKWKILRGDTVVITAGKDRGQQGTIAKVIRDDRIPRVIVEGRNLVKRHIKRQGENPGGIITTESPLHYSNVQLVDPVTNAPVRVTWRFLEDGTKVRITRGKKASGSIIPRPEILKQRRKPRPLPGPKDTPVGLAIEQTAGPEDAPTHPAFTAGILPPRPSPAAAAGAADAVRSYSTALLSGAGGRRHPWRLPRVTQLSARHALTSWHGFAAALAV